jgi:hypothetical protein
MSTEGWATHTHQRTESISTFSDSLMDTSFLSHSHSSLLCRSKYPRSQCVDAFLYIHLSFEPARKLISSASILAMYWPCAKRQPRFSADIIPWLSWCTTFIRLSSLSHSWRIDAVASVEPSLTIINSKFRNVWSSMLLTASRRYAPAL